MPTYTFALGTAQAKFTIEPPQLDETKSTVQITIQLTPYNTSQPLPPLNIHPHQQPVSLTNISPLPGPCTPGTSIKTGLEVTVQTDPTEHAFFTVQWEDNSPPTEIPLPKARTVILCSQIESQAPWSPESLRDLITQASPLPASQALKQFHTRSRYLLPPDLYLDVVRAVEPVTDISTYLSTPLNYLRPGLLGYRTGRRVSSPDTLSRTLNKVDRHSEFSTVPLWALLGTAFCAQTRNSTTVNTRAFNAIHADVFDQASWQTVSDFLTPRAFGMIAFAASQDEHSNAGRHLSRHYPSFLSDESYDTAKRRAKDHTDFQTADIQWIRLLPDAASRSPHEWKYVLANVAYWLGETARRDGYYTIVSPLLSAAAGIGAELNIPTLSQRAASRARYATGLQAISDSSYQDAILRFHSALACALPTHPLPSIDRSQYTVPQPQTDTQSQDIYTAIRASDQAALCVLRRVQRGTLSPQDAQDRIEGYRQILQSLSPSRSPLDTAHDTATTYLAACSADLAARIRVSADSPENTSSPDSQSQTPLSELLQQASEQYAAVGRQADKNALEQTISESDTDSEFPSSSPPAGQSQTP